MLDMASQGQTVAAFASSTLAISGGVVAQLAPTRSVGDAGLYVGAGGLAAALALLVSSMGDKVGPHVVAIAKLLVENRAINVKLKSENLSLAVRILDLEKRLTDAEASASQADAKADAAEALAIQLKARADARFGDVDKRVDDVHRKADVTASRLAAVEVASSSGEIPKFTAPPATPSGTGP